MIIERFERQVRTHPDKIAVKTGSGAFTYNELDILSTGIANRIKTIFTSDGNVNIALLLGDAMEMIASVLGVLKSGGTYVPLVKDFPGKRIEYIIRHAEIQLFITDNKNKERLLSAANNKHIPFILIEDLKKANSRDKLAFTREICTDSDAYILYTSGSTGFPKGVRQTHRNIVHFIDRYVENLDLTSLDNLTLFSSFSHDASVMDIYSALLTGAALFPLDLKEEGIFSKLPQWLEHERISVWHSVPTVYRYFIAGLEGRDNADLPGLRYMVLGGEAVLRSDIEKFYSFSRNWNNCRLYNLYGQTESTYNSGRFFTAGDDIAVTLGDTVTGTEIFVVDDEGDEVEPLEVGEIIIVGNHVSPGYWKDEKSNREKFAFDENEKIYFTGDLGRRLIDGSIEYLGRKDSQVKLRGFRIELGEIENAVLQYDYIDQAAVIPVETGSQELFLACYFAADRDIDAVLLEGFLRERLLDYMIPSYFRQLDKLPVTVSGKIDRKALPAPAITSKEGYVPPGNELERKLVKIWSQVLHIGEEIIGVKGNFFEMGGHSLRAAILTSLIHRELQVSVPLSAVFDRQTVKGLAAYIRESGESKYECMAPVEKRDYYALSSAQRQMYLVQQLDAGGTGYNIPYFFALGEDADREKLDDTFKRLMRRQEVLRTSFLLVDEEVVQRVHDAGTVDFEMEYYETDSARAEVILKNFSKAFDFSTPPLMRAGLLKVESDDAPYTYALMVEFHHIITDNISLNLLEAEFMALYEGKELPERSLHYKDYSQWQNRELQKAALKKQEEYWLEVFAGEIPVLELPYDYPRPLVQDFEGRTVSSVLGKEETKGLKEIAREWDATLYMVLLAAFNVLFFRLGSQEDIIIGTPAATRDRAELQNIVGMFVNTLPLRNHPSGEIPFMDFLKQVKQGTLAAFENREYPFNRLVETLSYRRDPGRNPVYDVMFNLLDERHFKSETIEMNEQLTHDFMESGSRFDLSLTAGEREERIIFRFEYSTRLFRPGTIERIIGYFNRILSEVGLDPRRPLSAIEIMPEMEKEKILEMCIGVEVAYDKNKTLHGLFEEQAEKNPDSIALIGAHSITYEELNKRSGRLAYLLKEKGVTPGSIVAIMVERSVEMFIGLLGILKSGAAYLPIDPDYPQERIDYMLNDSGARILLKKSETNSNDRNEEATYIVLNFENLNFDIVSNFVLRASNLSSSELSYIIYTSGTTGKPKGVMVEHRNVAAYMCAFYREFEIKPADAVIQLNAYTFDAFVEEVFPVLLKGGKIVIPDKTKSVDIDELCRLIAKHRVSIVNCTPLLLNEFNKNPPASVHTFISGGDILKREYVDNLLNSGTVYNSYGPTEATICATYYNYSCAKENTPFSSIPIGRPITNYDVYILDKSSELVPFGVVGELCISGPGITRGYLNNPELTKEKFLAAKGREGSRRVNMSYRTGDLGRWLPDGNVEFLGRIDHQVKIRGFRIELGEIESRLLKHDLVKAAVVMDREEQNGEKYLCAYIVSGGATLEELREHLSGTLPGYMIPSHFVNMDNIPLTSSGKVDRKTLPAPGVDLGGEGYVPPGNEVEERLIEIWQQVLEVEGLGITHNFFQVGGDSIKAIQVAARLKKYDLELKINDLFMHPTIKALGKFVTKTTRAIPQETVEGNVELTPIQQWFFRSGFTDSHHFNQAVMLYRERKKEDKKAKGFDKKILMKVLKKLVQHHDALRMVYITGKNGVVQVNKGTGGKLFDFEIFDFTKPGDIDIKERIEKEAGRIQGGIDLETGPLVRTGLFRVPGGDYLLIVIHHLVVDGISWRILLEDLNLGYRQMEQGEAIRFQEKTDSFKYWAWKLKEYGEGVWRELDYWKAVEAGACGLEKLPVDVAVGGDLKKNKNSETAVMNLDKTGTEHLLRRVNRAYNTEINDILLAALGMAVKEWAGIDKICIELEGHGREPIIDGIDISRTVGWFTTQYPVILDLSFSGEISYMVKEVKETLRRIPNKGIGYGVLKYLTPDEKKEGYRFELEPEIGFNYLGQFGEDIDAQDGQKGSEGISSGQMVSPEAERKHVIDINGMLVHGELCLLFTYNKYEYKKSGIEKLVDCYRGCLSDIIDHCSKKEEQELTPVDLGYSGITVQEYEELENEIADID